MKTQAMAKVVSAHAYGTLTLDPEVYQHVYSQLKDNVKAINNSLK